MTDHDNRRKNRRYRLKVQTVVVDDGESFMIPGFTEDLSVGGLFLECGVHPALNSQVLVEIYLEETPVEVVVECQARVVRVKDSGMALEFINLKPTDLASLKNAVERNEA